VYDQEVTCEVGEDGLAIDGVSPGPHLLVVKGLAADEVRFEITQVIEVPVDLGTLDLQPAP
jgi:hypothetical protein